MKGLMKRFKTSTRRSPFLSTALLVGCLAAPGAANATVYSLTSNNSSATLNLGSSAGLANLTVDGVNQVNQQWYWFCVGSSGPQMDLSQITTSPFVTINSASQLTALYTNSTVSYGVQVQYTLAGQAAGSGKSGLTETARVFNYDSNISDPALNFNLLLYSDFTLRGPAYASDQFVQEGTSGGVSTSVQTLGNFATGTNNFTAITPANRLEAALFNQTLNELTTMNGYDLNGNTSAGPGHVTWAMEWNMAVNPSSSVNLSLLDQLVQVPEPSICSLVILGLGLTFLRRQRR